MDIKDICNAGGDILDAVADAVNRNDYSGLSDNVSHTVNRVVSQVREEAFKGTYGAPTHKYGKTAYTKQGQAGYRSIHTDKQQTKKDSSKYFNIYNKASGFRNGRQDGKSLKEPVSLPATVARHPAGRILGPIQLAWGILATSGFGITALVMAILLAAKGGTVFLVLSAVFGLLTALSITDIVRGSRKIGLVNRFYRYVRLIGARGYIAVEELAFQTGQQKDDVLRDLKKMMKKHMFLQGRLDSGQTTFMITQDAYQQYLQAEQQRKDREAQEREQEQRIRESARQADTQAQEAVGHAFDMQTKKILADGNAYIQMVHDCNGKIQNPKMSGKLCKLEEIMRRIFEQVEKVPQSADDLHKFMDYYLPTTTKLLNAYIDLDKQGIAGENILATKKEIEETLDTINVAFEKLLDGLFEDTAWDISSDISAMKTMMAQEGLTGQKDFNII